MASIAVQLHIQLHTAYKLHSVRVTRSFETKGFTVRGKAKSSVTLKNNGSHWEDFHDFRTINVLFITLVRSILLCGSIVWAPFYIVPTHRQN